jgi:hypothetical protein
VSAPAVVDDAVDQVQDEAEISHLDFDPRCQASVVIVATVFGRIVGRDISRCENESNLISICLGCGHRAFICFAHHEQMFVVDGVGCGRCRRQGRAEDVFAFTPVRG